MKKILSLLSFLVPFFIFGQNQSTTVPKSKITIKQGSNITVTPNNTAASTFTISSSPNITAAGGIAGEGETNRVAYFDSPNSITSTTLSITGIGTTTVTGSFPSYTVNTASSLIQYTRTITSAELLAGSPITLIAATGAGTFVEVVSGSIRLIYNSTAYSGSQLNIIHTGATQNVMYAPGTFTDETGDLLIPLERSSYVTGATRILPNTDLTFSTTVSSGNSNMVVYLTYVVKSL